jgi:hypothetical protein
VRLCKGPLQLDDALIAVMVEKYDLPPLPGKTTDRTTVEGKLTPFGSLLPFLQGIEDGGVFPRPSYLGYGGPIVSNRAEVARAKPVAIGLADLSRPSPFIGPVQL